MLGIVTTIAFVAGTALLAVLQARRAPGGAAATARCPRCGAAHAATAHTCPRCRAPLRAFDLVTARIVTGEPEADAGGPLHAIVRADVCVGCGTCVDACPEPGAIQLVNKLATVDPGRCKGHGACASACPVGGIAITSGAAVQNVLAPELTTDFESPSTPGLYVVGELGGRGLIKNAINEGRLAMEHVARALAQDPFRGNGEDGVLDVIIAGAGPAGLSAGLEASHQGLRYALFEQGTLADTIAKYPRHKLLFAEPLRVPLYGNLWIADASKEALLQCWRNVIAKTGLRVTEHTRVESVERDGPLWRVAAGGNTFRARRVVLAMGRRGTPRRLGVPGEQLDKVLYDIVEMEEFAGRRMLVVGGGDSAIESALGLAHQDGATVTLSYRGTAFTRLKDRNREKLEAAVAAGRIALLPGSTVREIRRDVVVLDHEGALRILPNDHVIVRIGGEAPTPFLERTGVRIVRKELALDANSEARLG